MTFRPDPEDGNPSRPESTTPRPNRQSSQCVALVMVTRANSSSRKMSPVSDHVTRLGNEYSLCALAVIVKSPELIIQLSVQLC